MRLVRVLSLLLSAGCGSDAALPVTDESPVLAGEVRLKLRFRQLGGSPLAGASVCLERPRSECVATGQRGEASFVVPKRSLALLTVQSDAVAPAAHPVAVGEVDLELEFTEPPRALVEQTFAALGVTLDTEQGLVIAFVEGGAGVTAELSPSAGEGPFYLSPLGLPLSGAEALPADGGAVAFLNVPPGEVALSLSREACAFTTVAWPGDVQHEARALSLRGFGTALRASCRE